ncbi:MAG: hypothetical protein PIR02_16080 [Microbacterium enclense]
MNNDHQLETRHGAKRLRRERPAPEITPWHMRILNALQGRQVFEGIDLDDPAAANRLAKRRRRNRIAKASRKTNRR